MGETIKKSCKCEKCGNEAEMVITCSLPEEEAAKKAAQGSGAAGKMRGKASVTCTHCGNEADMWVDLE